MRRLSMSGIVLAASAATDERKSQVQTASREPFSIGDIISLPNKAGDWTIESVLDVTPRMLRCVQKRPNGRWKYCDVPLDEAKKAADRMRFMGSLPWN